MELFRNWLAAHPTQWKRILSDEVPGGAGAAQPWGNAPQEYRDLIEKIGPGYLFDWYELLGPIRMRDVRDFIAGLPDWDEEAEHSALVPFCAQGSSSRFYCFEGEGVVDFDPLEPFDRPPVAENLESFLNYLIEINS